MPENIELKARVTDRERLRAEAFHAAGGSSTILHQTDTFFHTSQGRLKLREMGPGSAELLYYERDDQASLKLSSYRRARIEQPEDLKETLGLALGIRGVVRKQRTLYLIGQTRVHLDEVEGLGDFVEIEVVLQPGQLAEEGWQIGKALQRRLHILDRDLIDCAYIDLLERSAC